MDTNNLLQSNQRQRSLFLILIFTLVASGITLALLSQIQNYEHEQTSFTPLEVLLKQKNKQQANPLPTQVENINIENWKVYRNKEYGFEFGYPQGWVITNDLKAGVNIYETGKQDKDQISVWVDSENLINRIRGVHSISNEEDYIFQGVSTKKLSGYSGITAKPVYILIFEKNDNFFTINLPPSLFDQVLSTFKFTK